MLRKIQLAPGINKENTRYTNEGKWYDCDKVRFRQGTPEKIGGWVRSSTDTFLGTCRSLWNWVTLSQLNVVGVGTNSKFYIESGGAYNDVTPIQSTATLNGPFDTVNASATVTVHDTAHGSSTGSYVTFSGAAAVAGLTLNAEYQLSVVDDNTYTIQANAAANATVAGGGGATVAVAYQLNVGSAGAVPVMGWGAGGWGTGTWGVGLASTTTIRLWSQQNFGEDLVFAPRGGRLYQWDASAGVATRAVAVADIGGATDVPLLQTAVLVTDNRFVFALGTNDYLSSTFDPMLVRWADQESVSNWTPGTASKAGSQPLARGSKIVTGRQTRQEVLVWSDAALYSLQFIGYPSYWGATLLGDNVSIISPNAIAIANGVTYWMGTDKFYLYDGRVQTLPCDLRKFVFSDINTLQADQVFCGTNEGFNEVWWWYCSAGSDTIDLYVVFNYAENIWYHGTMARTAWLDTAMREKPLAATYNGNTLYHESGVDSDTDGTPAAIEAYITSSEFDLDDGHHFVLVRRVLPDVSFEGSTATTPALTMYLLPLKNAGAGYTVPASEGSVSSATISRVAAVPIEEFTGQAFVRVRGRQMAMKIESTALGVTWQLGSPRLDLQPDGRR